MQPSPSRGIASPSAALLVLVDFPTVNVNRRRSPSGRREVLFVVVLFQNDPTLSSSVSLSDQHSHHHFTCPDLDLHLHLHCSLTMLASRSFNHRASASSASLIRRLPARCFSAQSQPDPSPPPPPPPPVPIAAAAGYRRRGLASGSLLQFLSSIALGSGLGIAYWRCTSEGDGLKPFVAFADSSATPAAESAVDDPRSRSLFRNLSLPGYSPKYLFGGTRFVNCWAPDGLSSRFEWNL